MDLTILLGAAQRGLGDAGADATLTAAFDEARARDDAQRMADAALAFAPAGAQSGEQYIDDAVLERYGTALTALGTSDDHRRAVLLARIASGRAWRLGGDVDGAAVQAAALARAIGDERTLADVLLTVRRSMTGSMRVGEQQELDDELRALAERLDDPGLRVGAELWRFDTAVEAGRGDELESHLDAAAAHAQSLRPGVYHHSIAYHRAALALLRGSVTEAEVLVDLAAQTGREGGVDATIVEAIRLTQMMGVRHEQGRLGQLRDEADAFFSPAPLAGWRCIPAFVDAELGNLATVGAGVDEMLTFHEQFGHAISCSAAMLAHMAAPTARLGDPSRARRLWPILEPGCGYGSFFAYFAGPVDYHLGLLARTLGDVAQARTRFAAAAAFAERLGAPRWRDRAARALVAAARD